jgi:hypothetical protein
MTMPPNIRRRLVLSVVVIVCHTAVSTGSCAALAVRLFPRPGVDAVTLALSVGWLAGLSASVSTVLLMAIGTRQGAEIVGVATAGLVGLLATPAAGIMAGVAAFSGQVIAVNLLLNIEYFRPLRKAMGEEAIKDGDNRVPSPVRGMARLAAIVAGRRWAGGYVEWLADLNGDPSGEPMDRAAQLRYAGGLLAAAARMRLADLRWSMVRCLDWLLATQQRIFTTAVATVGLATVAVVVESHSPSAVVGNAQNLIAIGAGVWSGAIVLRRVRGLTNLRPDRSTVAKPQAAPPSQSTNRSVKCPTGRRGKSRPRPDRTRKRR